MNAVYQMLKLGKHKPIYKIAKDGIITVKLKNSNSKEEYSSDNNSNSKSSIASKLKMYAQVCKQCSQDYLKNLSLDKSIFEHHITSRNNQNPNVNQENGANKNSVPSPLNSANNNTNETMNGLDKQQQQQHQNTNEESGNNQDQHHQTNLNTTSYETNNNLG